LHAVSCAVSSAVSSADRRAEQLSLEQRRNAANLKDRKPEKPKKSREEKEDKRRRKEERRARRQSQEESGHSGHSDSEAGGPPAASILCQPEAGRGAQLVRNKSLKRVSFEEQPEIIEDGEEGGDEAELPSLEEVERGEGPAVRAATPPGDRWGWSGATGSPRPQDGLRGGGGAGGRGGGSRHRAQAKETAREGDRLPRL
jgi:hypothetical protein